MADGDTEDAWEKLGPGQQLPSSIPGPVALVMGAMETREGCVCVWKEGGEAGRAPGSSVSTLGYRFPHLPDPGQGAREGQVAISRLQSRKREWREKRQGRRSVAVQGAEPGTQVGWASREFPSSHGTPPFFWFASLRHWRATIWGRVTLNQTRSC